MSLAESKRSLRQQLRLHRLNHGLSLEALRDEIQTVTGIRISPPTLVRFIEAERNTNEVHVHAIRRYLATFDDEGVRL